MQTFCCQFINNTWSGLEDMPSSSKLCQLLLVFGERTLLETIDINKALRPNFPFANIISCSTAGEIYDGNVYDDSIVCTGIYFEKTALHFSSFNISDFENTYSLGKHAAGQLKKEGLKYVLLLSDGNKVNGTALTQAVKDSLEPNVIVTGGLAGDKARFEKTLVGFNENIAEGNVVLTGLYGDNIKVGYGLKGGWEPFGPERKITSSAENILRQIDGKNALDLYKKYLGKYADELPASALLFPLSIQQANNETTIVRTILKINEQDNTMTFAGDMPEGATVRFMKADFDKLVVSAGEAAEVSTHFFNPGKTSFALLISCVGRKLVLAERTGEEILAALRHFPGTSTVAGFYSYGEISPQEFGVCSDLHNQTMTITTFTED